MKAAITSGGGGIVAASLAQNGYVKFANGLILQWGYTSNGRSGVRYPIAYSIAAYIVNLGGYNGSWTDYPYNVSKTGFNAAIENGNYSYSGYWLSIGQ